jgi:hypothetical protein
MISPTLTPPPQLGPRHQAVLNSEVHVNAEYAKPHEKPEARNGYQYPENDYHDNQRDGLYSHVE